MLGELINKFDTLENATLKDFNTTFNMSLEGSENALVEIGDIVVGERREVFIDGNLELIELHTKDLPTKEITGYKKTYPVYDIFFDDKFLGTVNSYSDLAHVFNSSIRNMQVYVKSNRHYYGYTFKIRQVDLKKYNELKKKKIMEKVSLNRSKKKDNRKHNSGVKSKHLYYFTDINGTIQESSLTKLSKTVGISKKTLECRIRKNKTRIINGWSIYRTKEKL